MRRFHPEKKQGKALYVQLGGFIIDLIREGEYRVGDKLPPVNMANGQLDVARDTIIKAYKYLQESGWVRSVPGKGFFVSKCQEGTGKNLFILFDAMNQYKETLYRSLLDSLGSEYHYDTAFHYYDRQLFERLINNALGKYDGYVIIPHFNVDVRPILRNIPAKRLLLLDAFPRNYDQPCSAVFQDFHKDIYEELNALHEKLQRYEALHVVYNDKFQFIPHELLGGMYQFCGETHGKPEEEPLLHGHQRARPGWCGKGNPKPGMAVVQGHRPAEFRRDCPEGSAVGRHHHHFHRF